MNDQQPRTLGQAISAMEIGVLIAAFVLIVVVNAQARYYLPKPHTACKAHYRREVTKVRERRHGKLVRKHGKVHAHQARLFRRFLAGDGNCRSSPGGPRWM